MTESTGTGSLDDVKTHHTHTFSSSKLLTRVTEADKLVLVNPFDEITVKALFIRYFKLICTALVIDSKHRSQ